MAESLVGVVISTYNRVGSLPRALRSVLEGSYRRVVVVIVDDGSRDGTAAFLTSIDDDRLTVVTHPENRGVCAARNAGLEVLEKWADPVDLVCFVDSDDALVDRGLERLVETARTTVPSPALVFGLCHDMHTGAVQGWTDVSPFVSYEDALAGRWRGDAFLLVAARAIRGRRFDERAWGAEGVVWVDVLREGGPALVTDIPTLLVDRSGTDRVSRVFVRVPCAAGKMWVSRTMVERHGRDLARIAPERYAEILVEGSKWALLAGDRSWARWALGRARRTGLSGTLQRRTAAISLASVLPRFILARYFARRYSRR